MAEQLPEVLDLNVGGMHVTTLRSTLTKYPDSMLAAMFSGRHVVNRDKDGRYVIDCDGKIFGHILEFLRFGTLPPVDVAEAVYTYSVYFQLIELSESLCKFQPVNHLLQLSNLKERNATYALFANKVIERLSKCMAKKNDNIVIIVTREKRENCYGNQFLEKVRYELQQNIQTLACLEVEIVDFDRMGNSEKDEIFFLAADLLRTLGYGSNILYYLGSDTVLEFSFHRSNRIEFGLILICNDNALSKLHTIPRVRFKSVLNDSR